MKTASINLDDLTPEQLSRLYTMAQTQRTQKLVDAMTVLATHPRALTLAIALSGLVGKNESYRPCDRDGKLLDIKGVASEVTRDGGYVTNIMRLGGETEEE